MSNTIKNYWASLEQRERAVLGGGAVLVLIILFYALVWQPSRLALNQVQDTIGEKRINMVWMRQQADALKGGGIQRDKPKRGSEESLTSVIEKSAKLAKVGDAIQKIAPGQSNEEVRVVLEGVGFNQWVIWVDSLYKNYGVDISDLNIEKSDDKPNIADVRVTFLRA